MRFQQEKANLLRSLHIKGDPLILHNVWDAGSAKAIEKADAKVIATSSWAVAAAHGYEDGEQLPFELALANLQRIIASVKLPITFDLEGGYEKMGSKLQSIFKKVIEAGAVGINFEDQVIGGKGLYSIAEQSVRIKALREVAKQMAIPVFINARTDVFFQADPAQHSDAHVAEVLQRVAAYAVAGADGIFVPALAELKLIEKLCKLSPLPVNIMLLADTPTPEQLAKIGVARVSHGPGPYCRVIDALKIASYVKK